MTEKHDKKQTILVVDDAPENIDILSGILGDRYVIRAATNGETTLKIAAASPPDLILLDVMMPGMDGFEICRRLKSNDATAKIPVIFITALGDVTDESAGFAAGGVDYITKPVNPPVVKARVRTHLALYDQNRLLEEMVRERTSALSEINSFFQSVMESTGSAIAVVGRDGLLSFVNPQALRLTGRAEASLLNSAFADLFGPDDRDMMRERLAAVMGGRTAMGQIEAHLVRPDETAALVTFNLSPRVMDRSITGAVLVGEDVTEKKSMEAQLIHSSKMASIGEMATGMAHELNQPLCIINMAAQMITSAFENKDISKEVMLEKAALILKQVSRASGIINHLRTFGRKEEANMVETNVNVPIREAVTLLGEQLRNNSIGVTLELDDSLPLVAGDSNRLEQVFMNLIMNARDALCGFERTDTARAISVRSYNSAPGGGVTIEISDNGPGIPRKIIDRIFEPFFTTKEIGKGTGLGLSISYGIIKSHGGVINVKSDCNGTTFIIQLPVKH